MLLRLPEVLPVAALMIALLLAPLGQPSEAKNMLLPADAGMRWRSLTLILLCAKLLKVREDS